MLYYHYVCIYIYKCILCLFESILYCIVLYCFVLYCIVMHVVQGPLESSLWLKGDTLC